MELLLYLYNIHSSLRQDRLHNFIQRDLNLHCLLEALSDFDKSQWFIKSHVTYSVAARFWWELIWVERIKCIFVERLSTWELFIKTRAIEERNNTLTEIYIHFGKTVDRILTWFQWILVGQSEKRHILDGTTTRTLLRRTWFRGSMLWADTSTSTISRTFGGKLLRRLS